MREINNQISIELNIAVQSLNDERKKNPKASSTVDMLIKELLKVQEILLTFPDRTPHLTKIGQWLIKVVNEDQSLIKTITGKRLEDLGTKISTIQGDD